MENRDFKVTPFISFYGFAHMAVDAACAFLMLAVLRFSDSNAIIAMLTYNSIAFVLQAPLGVLIDKILNPKYATSVGLLLVAGAFMFSDSLFAALIMAGIGNALFHVGGGS